MQNEVSLLAGRKIFFSLLVGEIFLIWYSYCYVLTAFIFIRCSDKFYKASSLAMKRLILFELVLLFLATTFPSHNPPGWYQIAVPVNDQVVDISFVDSSKGWYVTPGNTSANDTAYIIHTSNG